MSYTLIGRLKEGFQSITNELKRLLRLCSILIRDATIRLFWLIQISGFLHGLSDNNFFLWTVRNMGGKELHLFLKNKRIFNLTEN